MPKFTLRLPDDLYADLKELAEKETRSLHNMVIHILRMYIKQVKEAKKED
jgi:predicted transcriptional regulator